LLSIDFTNALFLWKLGYNWWKKLFYYFFFFSLFTFFMFLSATDDAKHSVLVNINDAVVLFKALSGFWWLFSHNV